MSEMHITHSLIKIEQDDKTSLIVFVSLTFISKLLLQNLHHIKHEM